MYIKAIKLNRVLLRWIGTAILILAAVFLTLSLAHARQIRASTTVKPVRFTGIKTNEDRVGFLKQFGWDVEEAAIEVVQVTIPKQFDQVYLEYNALQKTQGLDLVKYQGKTAKRWTYRVLNYPGAEGEVVANLLLCGNRIIACDISSTELGGFMQGVQMPTPTVSSSPAQLAAEEPETAAAADVGEEVPTMIEEPGQP
ncbi:MAG: DUF4830 domain-containing protein [Clostridia bacterium]|nr:DUF4830 domain-containing protein [Clostridia bacterium]